MSGLARALAWTAALWTAVLLAAEAARRCAPDLAGVAGFSAGAGLAFAAGRPWLAGPLHPWLWLSGGLAGAASYPSWLATIAWAGTRLGLTPLTTSPPACPGVGQVVLLCLAGPVFEELLYRGRVLGALRKYGVAPAVLGSSALFALPHLEAWSVLGTFLVGLALGGTRVLSGSVGLCIALHAGLNLSALAGIVAVPAFCAALAPVAPVAFGSALHLARSSAGGPHVYVG